ncbi:MAG: hypothetical protein BWX98_02507 [Candidatus Aminicenantes bacterium ADurb.Bin147]|nr:MAG: hypothetical protein BWX98_02507 [Candidatus Aminicenantes bacterium ADurb.Bin147]
MIPVRPVDEAAGGELGDDPADCLVLLPPGKAGRSSVFAAGRRRGPLLFPGSVKEGEEREENGRGQVVGRLAGGLGDREDQVGPAQLRAGQTRPFVSEQETRPGSLRQAADPSGGLVPVHDGFDLPPFRRGRGNEVKIVGRLLERREQEGPGQDVAGMNRGFYRRRTRPPDADKAELGESGVFHRPGGQTDVFGVFRTDEDDGQLGKRVFHGRRTSFRVPIICYNDADFRSRIFTERSGSLPAAKGITPSRRSRARGFLRPPDFLDLSTAGHKEGTDVVGRKNDADVPLPAPAAAGGPRPAALGDRRGRR